MRKKTVMEPTPLPFFLRYFALPAKDIFVPSFNRKILRHTLQYRMPPAPIHGNLYNFLDDSQAHDT
jgi:hypothetical protein